MWSYFVKIYFEAFRSIFDFLFFLPFDECFSVFLVFHKSSLSTISDINGKLHSFVAGQWANLLFIFVLTS